MAVVIRLKDDQKIKIDGPCEFTCRKIGGKQTKVVIWADKKVKIKKEEKNEVLQV